MSDVVLLVEESETDFAVLVASTRKRATFWLQRDQLAPAGPT